MTRLIRNPRVFIIAVVCGVIISTSYYLIRPLEANSEPVSGPLMVLPAALSILTIVPRIFVARILWEAIGLPELMGEVLFFLYWPFLGALLGLCKHWILWTLVILVINIGLVILLLYALSRASIFF